jgi:hypothetical protein
VDWYAGRLEQSGATLFHIGAGRHHVREATLRLLPESSRYYAYTVTLNDLPILDLDRCRGGSGFTAWIPGHDTPVLPTPVACLDWFVERLEIGGALVVKKSFTGNL